MSDKTRLFFYPASIIVLLDQASKVAISRTIPAYGTLPVIKGFFNLVHVKNRGIAFGLMNRPEGILTTYLLPIATVAVILLLIYLYFKIKSEGNKIVLGLSLVLGGAVGNLIDRLLLGHVLDFLDFHIGSLHWPAFNIADASITVGALWVAGNMLFSGREKRD
ncbi:MAG: signal peptidase II [Deltaproteobacteria bacterium]|nr:signal peptidase II [Deltaproteobacteria bacterium]